MNRCEKFENELLHPPPLNEKDLLQDGGNDEEAHRQLQEVKSEKVKSEKVKSEKVKSCFLIYSMEQMEQ